MRHFEVKETSSINISSRRKQAQVVKARKINIIKLEAELSSNSRRGVSIDRRRAALNRLVRAISIASGTESTMMQIFLVINHDRFLITQ